MKPGVLHKIFERLGQLGAEEIQTYLDRLSRERGVLETIFNAIEEGIVVCDGRGRIQYHNAAAGLLLGFNEADILGEALGKFVRGLEWNDLVRSGVSSSRDLEISYPERRTLRILTIPLAATPAQRKTRPGFALILRDTTEVRQAVLDAAESERASALTALAAGVAHELGNPLNSFTIQLQLMERELRRLLPEPDGSDVGARGRPVTGADLHRIRESVRIAKGEVDRLDGIVKQFLRAMRPSVPHLQLLNLNDVVKESAQFFGPEIEDRDLILETELEERLPPVMLDPDQIKQVLFNLIKNAVQAMRSHGILHVATGKHSGGVWVSVRDTGGGIAPETMARLFEPFYTTKDSGTGLGLLIVRRIVREHGGELELDSAPGQGTTVRVRLPLPGTRIKLLHDAPSS
jgi:PAS domain S-box-containing protein